MKNFINSILCVVMGFCIVLNANAQVDPNNVPQPPTEKLNFFQHYFGSYECTAEYAGIKWKGSMEITSAVKGWYVDVIIRPKSEDGKIDRENFQRITWDPRQKKYNLWQFTTGGNDLHDLYTYTEDKDFIIARNIV